MCKCGNRKLRKVKGIKNVYYCPSCKNLIKAKVIASRKEKGGRIKGMIVLPANIQSFLLHQLNIVSPT